MRLAPSFVLSVLCLGASTAALTGCIVVHERPAPAPAAPAATVAPPAATTAPVVTPAPAAAPTLDGPKVSVEGKTYTTVKTAGPFGGNDSKASWRGFVYFLPSNTTTLPLLSSLEPTGVVFSNSLQIAASPYSSGFPGLDANRNDFFGIRYDGKFTTTATGEFAFRIEADDGVRLSVDNAPIASANWHGTPGEGRGVIKLGPGSHDLRVEYWQAGKGPVILRVWVTPPGGAEKQMSPTI